jgi:hypothetical protein
LASSDDGSASRFEDDGQVGVAFRFLHAMRDGRVTDGLALADENWRLCRIQAWLWNNRDDLSKETTQLDQLAASLVSDQQPPHIWQAFLNSEAEQFGEAWHSIDPAALGAASRRRRIARDYDLVILAPTGKSGGYFVTEATALSDAMTFVMHRTEEGWRVSSHTGSAPPAPGLPPAWWITNDPAVNALPDNEQGLTEQGRGDRRPNPGGDQSEAKTTTTGRGAP